MQSDDRLVLRLPGDLKAMFTALCENEGVSISAKIKTLMANEVAKKVAHIAEEQVMPKKPIWKHKNKPLSDFQDVIVTPLPDDIEMPVNASQCKINPLLDLINKDTEVNYISVKNNPVQSAINAQNKRKPKKKKR